MKIDIDKLEVVKSFKCANIQEAEQKYSELNDVRKIFSMISKYFNNINH